MLAGLLWIVEKEALVGEIHELARKSHVQWHPFLSVLAWLYI